MCDVWRHRCALDGEGAPLVERVARCHRQAVRFGAGARVERPLAHRQRHGAELPLRWIPTHRATAPRTAPACPGDRAPGRSARRPRRLRRSAWRRRRRGRAPGTPPLPATSARAAAPTGRVRVPRRSAPTSGRAARRAADRTAPRPRTAPGGNASCGVEHGRDHAEHPQLLVGELADVLDCLEQLADAAVAERLALQRHDDGLGRREAVDRQHAERRRAVDQHNVVVVEHREQGLGQDVFATGPAQQVHLGAGQVDGRRHQIEPFGTSGHGLDDVGQPGPADQHVVQRRVELVGIEAQRIGEARLRVEVDHEDAASLLGQRHPEGLHGRRLGHAALLIGDRDDLDHRRSLGPPARVSQGIGRAGQW